MPGLDAGRRSRLLAVQMVLLLLALTAIAMASCGSTPAPSAYKTPAAQDYSNLYWTEAFSKLQAKFSREYAFTEWKGINWKALYAKYQPRIAKAQSSNDKSAYYLALREYTREMRDGHVDVKPDDMAVFQPLVGGGFGLIVTKLDNGQVIAPWVKDGEPAAAAGMKPGAQVLQWGGVPVKQALATTSTVLGPQQPTNARREYEQLRFLVRAPVGTEKAVTFKNPGETASRTASLKAIDDGMETLAITDNRSTITMNGFPQKMVDWKIFPSNVCYIKVYC